MSFARIAPWATLLAVVMATGGAGGRLQKRLLPHRKSWQGRGSRPPNHVPPARESSSSRRRSARSSCRHCYECHSGDPAEGQGQLRSRHARRAAQGGRIGDGHRAGPSRREPADRSRPLRGAGNAPQGTTSGRSDRRTRASGSRWAHPIRASGKAAKARNKIDLAEARKYWAFQHPKTRPAPKVARHGLAASPTSTASSRRAARKRTLKPVADADRVTLIRRADVRPDRPAADARRDRRVRERQIRRKAFASVVDRLLASPRFGERWGRHWLDVVRYGESTGKERNIPYRYAWRYRNYVIDAFNADKPYDRFIVEQLAGDLLPSKNAAEHDKLLIATGFLAIGPKGVNTKNPEQFKIGRDRRPDRRDGPGLSGNDDRLRPLPRPQVRPDSHDRLLRDGRHLPQHRDASPASRPGKKTRQRQSSAALWRGTSKHIARPSRPTKEQEARRRKSPRSRRSSTTCETAANRRSKKPAEERKNAKGKPKPAATPPSPKVDHEASPRADQEARRPARRAGSERPPLGNLAMGVRERLRRRIPTCSIAAS